MATPASPIMGYGWRSSRSLIIGTACLALLTEVLLYGFVVPILPYMLEVRLRQDPALTQQLTTSLLGIHGFATLLSAPILAHFIDKTSNRRSPLLVSLSVALGGTILVAATPTYWALTLGRVIQGIAGAAAWIVCLAILTENAGEGNVGKMMGLSMSVVMTGTVGGPALSGALLELAGYWPAWYLPIGVLIFNIFVWLILIEPQGSHSDKSAEANGDDISTAEINNSEASPLLSPIVKTHSKDGDAQQTPPPSNFYFIMASDPRVIVSFANVFISSVLTAALNTTLPVHLRQIFGWGPLDVGTMFLLLRVPAIVLGPFSGWLRDLVGLRYPTTIGWVLLSPLFVIMGLPGNGMSWASGEDHGKPIFVFSMIGIGMMLPLIQGSGMLHALTILEEFESKQRNIFGAHGGRSRVFAMTEISFNLGLMLGPLLAGLVSENSGFDVMSMTLASLCLVIALLTHRFFVSGRQPTEGGTSA
ncbi:major facilitator superfamily domain-containing protein [Penicillium odoratum]|uniref:major facilitator superfamily domain-containing protein n=1 Tax=Penicillium odoratum TaxID=1167516 RepID=UPI00254707B1|nr:major facilitator superfamily domain-containing protein [Penicillium odoratum]KAJ5759441.1 major facilitator superfamily domain-containing protein [Penicillium odoratum]